MNEFQKAELIKEIDKLINGKAVQVHFALSLLSAVRRVNAFAETSICLSELGRFKECDDLVNRLMQASETVSKQMQL